MLDALKLGTAALLCLSMWAWAIRAAIREPKRLLLVLQTGCGLLILVSVVAVATGFAHGLPGLTTAHRYSGRAAVLVLWLVWPLFAIAPIERAIRLRRFASIGMLLVGALFGWALLLQNFVGYAEAHPRSRRWWAWN